MKFDKDFSAIHGYLCSDGYVTSNLPTQKHKYYSIGLRNTNLTLLKDFQSKFYAIFGVNPKLIEGQRCRLYSKPLYYKLMENGPYHSNNWSYPDLDKENSRYWLRAFFDCEGWVISDRRHTRSICAETVNRDQLPRIKAALHKLGISSKIYTRKNRNTSILTIPDKKSICNFQEQISFLHPIKKEKLAKAISSFIDYDWDISEENIREVFYNKAKINLPYIIRIMSIKRDNLEKISNLITKLFNIESKIYKNKNGQGNIYYYLAIQKQGSVMQAIKIGLIKKEYSDIIIKNLIKQ
ncbi:MAG: LAGLIDADG family homing endonuclease [Nanoarchaeota archaeon]|nr:LAGLIDADG family homing endonuclease [Nanoarchaeota archaeon]MBU1704725.1 LAGLIDADG family homing endonuclease [Nanoarchaeota archaeon]